MTMRELSVTSSRRESRTRPHTRDSRAGATSTIRITIRSQARRYDRATIPVCLADRSQPGRPRFSAHPQTELNASSVSRHSSPCIDPPHAGLLARANVTGTTVPASVTALIAAARRPFFVTASKVMRITTLCLAVLQQVAAHLLDAVGHTVALVGMPPEPWWPEMPSSHPSGAAPPRVPLTGQAPCARHSRRFRPCPQAAATLRA